MVVCAEGREGGQGRTGALVPDAHEGGKGEEYDAHPLWVFAVARKLPPTEMNPSSSEAARPVEQCSQPSSHAYQAPVTSAKAMTPSQVSAMR